MGIEERLLELLGRREDFFSRPISVQKGEVGLYEDLCEAFSGSEFHMAVFPPGSFDPLISSSPCSISDFLSPEEISVLFSRALSGEVVKTALPASTPSGEERALTVSSVSVSGSPSALIAMCSSFDSEYLPHFMRSISQYVSMAITLIREIRRQDLISETLPVYLYIKDTDFNIIYHNRCFEECFGAPLGKKCYEALKGSTQVCPGCPSLMAISTGNTVRKEWAASDGREFISIHRFVEDIGQVINVGVEITEMKEMERAAAELISDLRELEFIINKSPSVTFLWRNEEGWPVEYVTENVSAWGYSPEDFTSGKIRFADVIHPEDRARIESEVRSHSSAGEPEFVQEYRIVTKGGLVRWVKDYTWVRRDRSGNVTHYQGIVLDITEEVVAKEALRAHASNLEQIVRDRERQLRESERMAAIGEAAAMVGHDLRNPLQVVANVAFDLKETLASLQLSGPILGRVRRELEMLEKQVSYMDKIVSDLNFYSRPLRPKPERFELAPLLRDIVSTLGIPETIRVELKVDPALKEILSDPLMLKRAVTNLATNAIQAMPSGGTLGICASPASSASFSITVTDTGTGIPEEIRGRIFEPFFTGRARGMGMGLKVAKRIAEALGGHMEFESTVGKGSSFTLVLPISESTCADSGG